MEQNTGVGTPVTPIVENKQKGGNGLKIATAIACIVAVCGIGFGVYGMMQSSQKDDQINSLKDQIEGSNNKEAEEGEAVTDTQQNVKYFFTNKNNPDLKEFETADISSWRGLDLHLGADGSVKVTFQHVEWDAFASEKRGDSEEDDLTSHIDGRVVDIAAGLIGNGGIEEILFLLDDGTVSYISTEKILSKEYNFEKLSNVKDVVRIYGNQDIIDYAGFVQLSSGKISPIMANSDTLYVK
ncbi:hypothetical protein IKF20_02245 [Candidatus Saccharibacteria bacterium]|nr:hypothetical protein [Candidatus Saccharibacteria bacterium]